MAINISVGQPDSSRPGFEEVSGLRLPLVFMPEIMQQVSLLAPIYNAPMVELSRV